MKSSKASRAMITARKYAKKEVGGPVDVDGFLVTPGGDTGAPTRIVPRPRGYQPPDPNDPLMGSAALRRRRVEAWAPFDTKELPAYPEHPPEVPKPTRYFPEPLLSDRLQYQLSGDPEHLSLPEDVEAMSGVDNNLEFMNKETGDPVYFSRRGTVLPVSVDREGGWEWSMPGILDPIGNIMGGIIPGARIAAKGGEKVLGSGPVFPKGVPSTVTSDILSDMSAAVESGIDSQPKVIGQALQKSLKKPYPKDLAVEAIKVDLQADELANLTSYLSPGAQAAFWKWHAKLSGVKPEAASPPPPLPLKQALSPENAKKQGWDKDYTPGIGGDPFAHPHVDEYGKPVKIESPTLFTGPDTWKAPDKVATFVPHSSYPKELNGVPITPTGPKDGWTQLLGNTGKFPEPKFEAVAGKKSAAGVVIVEPDGRVWLTAPTNEFGGYKATLPKGGAEGALTMQENAIKEAFEETGLHVKIVGYLGDVERSTSKARYYIAERVGGTPTGMGWESQAIHLAPINEAIKLTANQYDAQILNLLANKQKGAKHPLSTGAQLPSNAPPKAFGSNYGPEMSLDNLTQTGGALGSNDGGQFVDKAGNKFYIKKPKGKEQVRHELIGASLYDLAGVQTLKYRPVQGGNHLATEWQTPDKKNAFMLSSGEKKAAYKDFAIHAWLGGYDAIGTGGDNLGMLKGKPIVLDTGGTLEYRAQGAPKGEFFTDKVKDIYDMRNPDSVAAQHNTAYEYAAKFFKDITEDEVRESSKRVVKLLDQDIYERVKAHGGSSDLANKLIARKRDIADMYGLQHLDPNGYGVKQKGVPKGDIYEQKPFNPREDDAPFPEDALSAKGAYEVLDDEVSGLLANDDKLPGALSKVFSEGWNKNKLSKAKPGYYSDKPVKELTYDDAPGQIVYTLANKHVGDTDISPWGVWGKKATAMLGDVKPGQIGRLLEFAGLNTPAKIDNLMSWMSKDQKDDLISHFGKELDKHGYKSPSIPAEGKFGHLTFTKPRYAEIASLLKPVDDWQKFKPRSYSKSGAADYTTPTFYKGLGGVDTAKKAHVRSLGFNTDFGLFHGGPGSEADTLLDPKIAKKNIGERAFFTSDRQDISKGYGTPNKVPFVARGKKGEVFEVEWKHVTGQVDHTTGKVWPGDNGYMSKPMHDLIETGHEMGAKLIIVHGIGDVPMHTLQSQYLVLDPAILRKTSAEFDPAKLHLLKPLAGLAGGGIMVYGAMRDDSAGVKKMKRGGSVLDSALRTAKKYATGGPLKTDGLGDPKNHAPFHSGMLHSDIPGRTDRLPIRLKSGSYVIPADIPSASALGEGNTMAGKKVLDKIMEPHRMRPNRGIQPIRKRRLKLKSAFKAEGGEVGEVPIVAAGGEYIVEPEVVTSIGGGDLDKGHENLDKFVRKVRMDNIKTLRKLPGPKKN